jgi:hypothetical protein
VFAGMCGASRKAASPACKVACRRDGSIVGCRGARRKRISPAKEIASAYAQLQREDQLVITEAVRGLLARHYKGAGDWAPSSENMARGFGSALFYEACG